MEATRTAPSTWPFRFSNCYLKLLFAPQRIAAKVVEQLARGRERQGPRRAVEQRDSQPSLHFLDMLAGSRLADLIHARAAADTLTLRYVAEKLQVIEAPRSRLS